MVRQKNILAKIINFIAIVSLVTWSFSPSVAALAQNDDAASNTNEAVVSETPEAVVSPAPVDSTSNVDSTPTTEAIEETSAEAAPVVEVPMTTPETIETIPEAADGTNQEIVAGINDIEIAPVIEISTKTSTVPILAASIISAAEPVEIWTITGDKATTNAPVELGQTYIAPQNKDVTVTFTKLPETPGTLSIEEIILTPEQITTLGAVSNKAYDITSDMADGTFAFNLNLPKPVNQENVQIKFAENEDGLKNAGTVATSDISTQADSVSTSLDHFTIFVVTTPTVTAPDCTGVSVSHSASDKCFNTIQEAIDDTGTVDGNIIKVKAGDYAENIMVYKGIILQGETGVNLTGQITIIYDNVTVNKFAITNPAGNQGILVKANGALIENSSFDNIGTSWSETSAVQAVYINAASSNITVKNNTFTNIGTDANTASNKAIYVGDSNNGPSANVNIEGNDISKVVANNAPWGSGGHGAYGILVNHQVTGLTVKNNTIDNIDGLWAHAIGLESDTPGAVVSGNRINNLKDYKDPSDAVALRLESNPSASTVTSSNNKYDGKNLFLDTANVYVDSDWSTLSTSGNTYPEVLENFYGSARYVYYGINAFATIQDAIAGVVDGGTIHVANGTFTEIGQIVIDKDISIIGQNKNNTIIKPAQDTGASGDSRGWFLVNSGKTLILKNATLDGIGRQVFQAIRGLGKIDVEGIIFKNISYPGYQGFGIAMNSGVSGNIVKSSTFSNIGREGVLVFGSGTEATITNNKYTGKGDGDWLDYAFEVGGGAQATISNNNISKNTGIASDGSTSAGIYATTLYGSGTQMTATGNTIFKCTDGITAGYDGSDTSVVVAHDNNLAGNVNGVNSTKPLVDATNNWWGNANGPTDTVSGDGSILDTNPSGTGSIALGAIKYAPWYTDKDMTILTSPNAITKDPTNIGLYDATLNGESGSYNAIGHSFWVSTSTFSTLTPNIPSGVYSTPDWGTINANSDFSALLSTVTTEGIISGGFHVNMPAITPNTTYYYVAWDRVGSNWYPGEIKSFTTNSLLAPTLNSPADNSFVRGIPSLTNSWSSVLNAVKYEYESYNDQAMHSLRYSSTYTTTTKTATNVADSIFWWRVRAVDAAGNKGPWSSLWKVTVDNTTPNAPSNIGMKVTSSSINIPDNSFTNQSGVTAYWSANNTEPVTYIYKAWYDNSSPYNQSNPWVHPLGATSYSGVFNQGDGPAHFCVVAVDLAGNQSPCSATFSVIYDSTAPVVDITAPSAGPVSGTVNIKGSVTDVNPDHYYLVVKNSSNAMVAGPGTVNDASSFTDQQLFIWDTTTVPDGAYVIDLEARDAAGNKDASSVKTISVTVGNTVPTPDTVAPVITLLGDNPVNLTVGDSYTDAGASALDDVDGDITANIITVNPVNTSVADTYIVTYDVADAAGNNSVQVSRTVIVIPVVTDLPTRNSFVGGGGSIVYCESAQYVCINNVKNIVSQTPATCSFTSAQLSKIGEPCEENNGQQQVLGVQKYAAGTLLRSNLNHRIYVVTSETTIQRILNLKELTEYKGYIILNVDESVIASFKQVLGVKIYPDGTLIRRHGSKKIYVVENGQFIHIKTLKELLKYIGQPIIEIE